MQEEENPAGVVIPSQAIENSDTIKRKSKKTLAQLPVYRAAANLKFIVTTLMMKSPKKLKLEMHKHKRYLQPVSHGIAFVGCYIKPNRVYLSNRTLARFEERAVGFAKVIDGKDELTILDCKRIEQVINSYLGFCKGKKTYKKRKEILGMMGENFFKYFYIRGHYESIRAKEKYREIVLPYQKAA